MSIVEKMALALFNRRRDQAMMRRVDHIGANNTPECNECRDQARAALPAAIRKGDHHDAD